MQKYDKEHETGSRKSLSLSRVCHAFQGERPGLELGKIVSVRAMEMLHYIACGTSKRDWTHIHWQLQKAYWIPPWAEGWSTWIVKHLCNPIFKSQFSNIRVTHIAIQKYITLNFILIDSGSVIGDPRSNIN